MSLKWGASRGRREADGMAWFSLLPPFRFIWLSRLLGRCFRCRVGLLFSYSSLKTSGKANPEVCLRNAGCIRLLSVSDQKQLGWENGYFTFRPVSPPLRDVRAETQGRNLEAELNRGRGGMPLTGLFSMIHSTCFLIAPQSTCLGLAPSNVAWETLPHHLEARKCPHRLACGIMLMAVFSQSRVCFQTLACGSN